MHEIIIDEEFQRLLPPLNEREFCRLEENILTYGCMNPLVLWNGILIDGYNRFNIVTKHNLPFNVISLELNSRDEVLAWMIRTQIDRRNLTPMQLTYYRGLHYNIEKKLHGGDRSTQDISSGQNDHLNGTTANRLSEQYNISPRTIRRDGQIADVIVSIGKESMEAKKSILTGEARISRKQLRELSLATEDEISVTAKEIETGNFEADRKPPTPDAPNDSIKRHPLTAEVIAQANLLIRTLQSLGANADSAELRKTVRSHIVKLEDIYKQI